MSTASEPLPVTLSRVLISFTLDFERGVLDTADRGGLLESCLDLPVMTVFPQRLGADPRTTMGGFLASWANLLRPIGGDVLRQTDLASRARLSKRAAQQAVGRAERAGWLTTTTSTVGRRRSVMIRLTDRGLEVERALRDRVLEVEDMWRVRYGPEVVDATRAALQAVVRQLDLELPHMPMTYGSSDVSICGGVTSRWGHPGALRRRGAPGFDYDPERERYAADAWEEESGGKIHIGAKGNDWRPVVRRDDAGDTVGDLRLVALLSQALVAYTIDYEGSGGLPLGVVDTYLRFLGDDRVRTALPTGGVNGYLERHGYAASEPDRDDKGSGWFWLTAKGRRVRDACDDVLAAVGQRWAQRYGADVVGDLRSATAVIADELEPDLPRHPVALLAATSAPSGRPVAGRSH